MNVESLTIEWLLNRWFWVLWEDYCLLNYGVCICLMGLRFALWLLVRSSSIALLWVNVRAWEMSMATETIYYMFFLIFFHVTWPCFLETRCQVTDCLTFLHYIHCLRFRCQLHDASSTLLVQRTCSSFLD